MKPQKQMFVICSEVNIMTTLTILKFLFQLVLICVGAYALLHEKELARFERKAVKYIKAFFKAVYISYKEKKEKNIQLAPVTPIGNAEYEEMLSRLSKASKLEDVLVA